jgi:hypothetical protein
MQKIAHYLTAERSPTKIAGMFVTRSGAQAVVDDLHQLASFSAWQIRLLGPEDARRRHHEWFSINVEPEPGAIGRTLVWTHVISGLAGVGLGLVLFGWLYASGQPMVAGSPWLSMMAIVGFSVTFGLLLGGLLALRPDHVRLIQWIRTALGSNRWVVVVHPKDQRQLQDAESLLRRDATEVMQTM